jgi:multicomponent Na+:H+ antiporter subunit E
MLLMNLLLALSWIALTGEIGAGSFTVGFALGYMILWVMRPIGKPTDYFLKVRRTIGFVFFFLWELVKANLKVAYEIMTWNHYMRPGVIAIPLDARTDAEIVLLSNLITLTPGTLSIDVADDRKVLYIHSMYIGDDLDAFRREVKEGLEKRVLEVLR